MFTDSANYSNVLCANVLCCIPVTKKSEIWHYSSQTSQSGQVEEYMYMQVIIKYKSLVWLLVWIQCFAIMYAFFIGFTFLVDMLYNNCYFCSY